MSTKEKPRYPAYLRLGPLAEITTVFVTILNYHFGLLGLDFCWSVRPRQPMIVNCGYRIILPGDSLSPTALTLENLGLVHQRPAILAFGHPNRRPIGEEQCLK